MPLGRVRALTGGILFLCFGVFLLVLTYWNVHYNRPDNPVAFNLQGITFVVVGLVLMILEHRG